MTRVLVTGGTGTLGSEVVTQLVENGYRVRVMSRSSSPPDNQPDTEWAQADLATGTGLKEAVSGSDIIVHATTSQSFKTASVDFEGTKRLLSHAHETGVSQFLYVSIVGIDTVPLSYYQHKLAAEMAVIESGVPWTIQRATQFHTLIDLVLQRMRWVPIWPLPTDFQFQPIAPADVAARLCELVDDEPAGRVPNLGGPDVLSLGEMARVWTDVRGLRRPLVHVPVPGRIAQGFRDGHTTVPDHRDGTISWRQWVEHRYASH